MTRRIYMALFLGYIVATAPALGNPSTMELVGRLVENEPLTARDVMLLPSVCVLIFNNSIESGKPIWYETLKQSPLLDLPEHAMAKGTKSFHHFCWGEVAMNRYLSSSDKARRETYLKRALANYKFILDHPEYRDKDWYYLPVIYLKLGQILSLAGQRGQAINAFRHALELNPNYVMGHVELAQALDQEGESGQALAQVTEGLKRMPGSTRLKNLYGTLGGKPPYPTPYPKAEKAPGAEQSMMEEDEKPQMVPPASPTATETSANETPTRPYGTPDNPYCRFCP